MQKKYPVSRKSNIVVNELNGEVLIYDVKENKAFCLNETSAIVWNLCDGNKSIEEISQSLGKKLNSSANEELVWLALDQLKKDKLIENEITQPVSIEGMSRREVIRKIGFTTMVALPLISSVIAPNALQAASGCVAGSVADNMNCTNVCQCPTNFAYVCCMVTANTNPNICWAGGAGACVV